MVLCVLDSDNHAAEQRCNQRKAHDGHQPTTRGCGDVNFSKSIFDYDTEFRLKHSDDLHGGQRWYLYNSGGFQIQVVDEANIAEQYVYDAFGRVTKRTDRSGAVWINTYNSAGRLIEARQPAVDGVTVSTRYTYDTGGNKLTEMDPLNRVQSWTYTTGAEVAIGGGLTPSGEVKTYKNANNRVTSYFYSSAGDLRRVVDPVGYAEEFDYDAIGRRVTHRSIVDATTRITIFSYDRLSRLTATVEPPVTNQITGNTHTRVIGQSYDGNSNPTVTVLSDSTGGDATRTVTNLYDNNDRLWRTSDASGAVTTTTFDETGNPVTVTDALGRIYRTRYNWAQRPDMLELTNYSDPGTTDPVRSITLSTTAYDVFGRSPQAATPSAESLNTPTTRVAIRCLRSCCRSDRSAEPIMTS